MAIALGPAGLDPERIIERNFSRLTLLVNFPERFVKADCVLYNVDGFGD